MDVIHCVSVFREASIAVQHQAQELTEKRIIITDQFSWAPGLCNTISWETQNFVLQSTRDIAVGKKIVYAVNNTLIPQVSSLPNKEMLISHFQQGDTGFPILHYSTMRNLHVLPHYHYLLHSLVFATRAKCILNMKGGGLVTVVMTIRLSFKLPSFGDKGWENDSFKMIYYLYSFRPALLKAVVPPLPFFQLHGDS